MVYTRPSLVIPQPRYNLRSQAPFIETEENDEESETEENDEESETESQQLMNLEESPNFDIKDLQGASLDNALDTIEKKNRSEHVTQWPNDAYCNFMKIIVENNISNSAGDKIIKFFN